MNNTELKHYGVIGMRWGHHKAHSINNISTKRAKKQDDDSASTNRKAKIVKGAKVAATILGVAGGVAISAYVIKRTHESGNRAGMLAAQKEMAMFRRAAAAKGVATRAANRAAREARSVVSSALSSIGNIRVNDYMSMVR